VTAALSTLLLDGNGKGAAQQLAELAAEVQQQEPQNAGLMLQLVSNGIFQQQMLL
jgi:hypothetical protein